MGRVYWSRRETVGESQNFDIPFLKKNGYLDDGCNKWGSINWSRNGTPTGSIAITTNMCDRPSINLDYTITSNSTGEKRSVNYDVRLLSYPCYFGGKRWFFECTNCFRNTRVLYRSSYDKFYCRKCNNLAYDSQNKNRRGTWYQVGKVLDSDKLEELPQARGKYQYYKGKATRNFKKYLYSAYQSERSFQLLHDSNWL